MIRGRAFDYAKNFLPDGLSMVAAPAVPRRRREAPAVSQIQGRTYANMFGLVERFIGAKILEVSRDHWLGDQVALEALVRFTDEELKHQELFRRIEAMIAPGMPAGYRFLPQPNEVAQAVLAASTWAVLGLTCHIELFTQAHYRSSIEADADLDPLWKDVFLYHWREESQHAILDELEWLREDAKLTREGARPGRRRLHRPGRRGGRDPAGAGRSRMPTISSTWPARDLTADEKAAVHATMLAAYRYQYIVSGVQDERFQKILGGMTNKAQVSASARRWRRSSARTSDAGTGRRPAPGPGAARRITPLRSLRSPRIPPRSWEGRSPHGSSSW